MTEAAPLPRRRGPRMTVRGLIVACLIAQIGVAAALVARQIDQMRTFGWAPEVTSAPERPIAPGDQVRPYRPTTMPRRPDTAVPGAAPPIDWPKRMPKRLVVTEADLPEFGEVVKLTGPLDAGAALRVAAHLDGLAEPPAHVALHSPGGLVHEALAIGRDLRARGIDTLMPAGSACLSACPYILAAGTVRRVSPEAWVGLHQSYYDASAIMPVFVAVESIQYGEAEAMRYLEEMGVDPMVKLPAMETPPDAIYMLTPEELLEYRMATELID